jgi:hypothetical protein
MPLRIRNNGEATFANVNISELSTENVTSGKYRILRNLEPYGPTFPGSIG